tara:strand:+ start:3077 stop:4504 length:1428 start_codon:yes stop_codon:yes gene_type:complete
MLESRSITFIIGLLFSALAVSAVAAYFSIVGLMAIFNGLPLSILWMGIVLEIAKLVTASWIYQYWSRVKFLMKTYMVTAVIVLSIITSIGIFGFLSKAHIEQSANTGDAFAEVQRIEQLIDRQRNKIEVAEERIDRIEAGGNLDVTESIRQQEEIRDTAWERIQGDITYAEEQIESIRSSLDTDIAQKQQELAELDAIVASYTTQGTTGGAFNRTDNVAKGIEVREQQEPQRALINEQIQELRAYAEQQIAGYRNQITQYRADTQSTIDSANEEINRLRDQETSSQDTKDAQIDSIQATIDDAYTQIEEYNATLFDKRAIVRDLEKEVGPIKYVAQLIYGDDSASSIDSAVLILIMLLIFVFDPLAIVLVIAANLSLKERKGEIITPVHLEDDVVEYKKEPDVQPVEHSDPVNAGEAYEPDLSKNAQVQKELNELHDVEPEKNWVSDKYGSESAMDPKKEVDLQWLIDKKLKDKE